MSPRLLGSGAWRSAYIWLGQALDGGAGLWGRVQIKYEELSTILLILIIRAITTITSAH